MHTSVGL